MAVVHKFAGRRSRGIVWVCDIAGSSKYLNSDESAGALETFLQRFLFMSLIFVEAAGGEFIKWTGDGFLAWFETPLHREVGMAASKVFNAAWFMTLWVNVSQLMVEAKVRFKIRHAVTFEHDALVIDLGHSGDKNSTDLLGRAVVLAFRLSSIKGEFPSIVTHKNLIEATRDTGTVRFKKLAFSKEERLKYFKDERWGVSDIYVSSERPPRRAGIRSAIRKAKSAIAYAENKKQPKEGDYRRSFVEKVVLEMTSGPEWCKAVVQTMVAFSRDELLGTLKQIVPPLEEMRPLGHDAR
jgi:class 3 adenylate cyclase